jgi:hypothetical protein
VIVTAALLVLLGLGLFVGGLLTGTTALYWACVGACVVAAGVLVVARRQIAARDGEPAGAASAGATAAPGATASTATTSAPAPATTPDAGPAATGPDLATGATAVPPATPPVDHPPVEHPPAPVGPPTGGHAAVGRSRGLGEPPVEEVEVTDLLIIVDLTDEVLVVDEHPRYHVPGCVHLDGHEPIPLPLDEARTDGFTPCGACRPDRQLADRARARKARGA